MELSFYLIPTGIILLLLVALWLVLRQRDVSFNKAKDLELMLKAILHKQLLEREKMTKRFHDGLKNDIVAAKNFLLLGKQSGNEEQRLSFLNDAQTAIDTAFENAKGLSDEVMPSLIKAGKITEAFHDYFTMQQLKTGREFSVILKSTKFEMPTAEGYDAYCIVLELVDNIVQHSNATRIQLSLFDEQETFVFELIDNGQPFNLKECYENVEGKGLKTVYARLLALNGSLIQKNDLQGNRIIIKTPIK
ncbi:MAG: hypothetical protein QM710_14905 [Flavobacterium sp.]